MFEQQYIEQCYQKLMKTGYPEDRIMKDYRLLDGLSADIAILPPGLTQLPMLIIEVKQNKYQGYDWLVTEQAEIFRKKYGFQVFIYCNEEDLFIDINTTKTQDKLPSYEKLKNKWLINRTYFSKLQLKNFMAFKSAEFQFGSKLNIIIGENGSGKTQIMKLLYSIARTFTYLPSKNESRMDFSQFAIDAIFGIHNVSELISNYEKTKAKEAQIQFSLSNQESICGFCIKNNTPNMVQPELNALSTLFSLRHDINKAVFLPAQELLSIFPGFQSMHQIYRDNWPYDQTISDCISYLGLPPIKSQENFFNKIIKEVEKAIHGHIYLNEQGTRFLMQMEHSKTIYEIPLVATGWRKFGQLLQLINTGAIYPGSILLWDEPDANMNPKLICLVAKVLLKLALTGVQVFIATHSLFLLRELEYLSHEQDITDSIRYIALGNNGIEQANNTADMHNILSFEEEIRQEDRIMALGTKRGEK